MTQEELQDLSRKAAKLLPKDELSCCWVDGINQDLYNYDDKRRIEWLHESTEACAEIMVRVLWPKGAFVRPEFPHRWYLNFRNPQQWSVVDKAAISADPVQAFRTAVLLALCEVMG